MSHKPYFKFQGGRYVRCCTASRDDCCSYSVSSPLLYLFTLLSIASTPGHSTGPYLSHLDPPPLRIPFALTLINSVTPLLPAVPPILNRYYGIAIVNSQGKKLKMPRGAVTVTYQIHRFVLSVRTCSISLLGLDQGCRDRICDEGGWVYFALCESITSLRNRPYWE